MYNRVVLIGRLTKEPDLRYTPQGKAVCGFTLAVNRMFRREETDFINIEVWGVTAENCAKYLNKGSMAAVEGSLQIDKYEKDGIAKMAAKVVASNVVFVGSKGQNTEQGAFVAQDDENDFPF